MPTHPICHKRTSSLGKHVTEMPPLSSRVARFLLVLCLLPLLYAMSISSNTYAGNSTTQLSQYITASVLNGNTCSSTFVQTVEQLGCPAGKSCCSGECRSSCNSSSTDADATACSHSVKQVIKLLGCPVGQECCPNKKCAPSCTGAK